MWLSSPQGSAISNGVVSDSSNRGMTCRRMGHSGLSRSMRLKKCGVTASESLLPATSTPARSFGVSTRCFSSCSRVVTPIFELPFPVVPLFWWNVRPVAGGQGGEGRGVTESRVDCGWSRRNGGLLLKSEGVHLGNDILIARR